MAKNSKAPEQEADQEAAAANPLIKTVSEHAALSEEEKQAFRLAGGTVTNDPENLTE